MGNATLLGIIDIIKRSGRFCFAGLFFYIKKPRPDYCQAAVSGLITWAGAELFLHGREYGPCLQYSERLLHLIVKGFVVAVFGIVTLSIICFAGLFLAV